MHKHIFAVLTFVLAGTCSVFAQKKGETVAFQEASAREASPNVAVFVYPQICDLKMLSSNREEYGPFDFDISGDERNIAYELANVKARALQRASHLAGADLIVEALYTSTVYDKDNKVIWVSLSGYPAKYVNFRSLGEKDLEMIRALYPGGIAPLQRHNDAHILSAGEEKSGKSSK